MRDFPDVPASWQNDALEEKWDLIAKTRSDILGAIEPMRASKELRSSLEAAPTLAVAADAAAILKTVDLAEICITAPVTVTEGSDGITIKKADGDKCERCWKILPEVGSEKDGVCNRCADAVDHFQKTRKAA